MVRTTATAVKEPPKVSDQVRGINFQQLGKQIASLSPLLMGGVSGAARADDGGPSATQQASAQFTSLINQIAGLKSQTAATAETTTSTNDEEASVGNPPTNGVAATVSQSDVDQLVHRALTRSQVFLNNEKARAALGSASLQVFVYSNDISAEDQRMAAFYMDAGAGKKIVTYYISE